MQTCFICKVELTTDNAYLSRSRGRFQSACKECGRQRANQWLKDNQAQEVARRKDYYKANRTQIRTLTERNRIKRKYGLTPEQLEELHRQQDGCCAICKEKAKLVIDHCHDSGIFRGLLCNGCNTALGMVKENPATLQACIEYLARNPSSPSI